MRRELNNEGIKTWNRILTARSQGSVKIIRILSFAPSLIVLTLLMNEKAALHYKLHSVLIIQLIAWKYLRFLTTRVYSVGVLITNQKIFQHKSELRTNTIGYGIQSQ